MADTLIMPDTLTLTPNSPHTATGDSGLVVVRERITTVPDDLLDAAEAAARTRAAPANVHLQICGDLAEVEAAWRAFEADAVLTPFQSFDWIATWQRHVGSRIGAQPVVVLGRDVGGRLLFILPLAIERHGAFRRLCWLASDLCDYNAPLLARGWPARTGQFAEAWRDVVRTLRKTPGCAFDLVDMSKLPQAIGDVRNPFLDLHVLANASSGHIARLSGTWDAYYKTKRSSESRRKERKQWKYMGDIGEVRFVHVKDGTEIDRTLETLMTQKARSFARMGVENLFARPGYPEFYRDVAQNRALIHVSRLDVGAMQAATNFGLTFRGCYYLVLSSYDDGNVSRFGPGRALLREVLRHSMERGFDRFDFTIGDEPYKLEWSDTLITLYDHISAASLTGWPLVARAKAFWRIKRFIKQTPALWAAFTTMRAAVAKLRGRKPETAEDHEDPPGDNRSPPIAPQ